MRSRSTSPACAGSWTRAVPCRCCTPFAGWATRCETAASDEAPGRCAAPPPLHTAPLPQHSPPLGAGHLALLSVALRATPTRACIQAMAGGVPILAVAGMVAYELVNPAPPSNAGRIVTVGLLALGVAAPDQWPVQAATRPQ